MCATEGELPPHREQPVSELDGKRLMERAGEGLQGVSKGFQDLQFSIYFFVGTLDLFLHSISRLSKINK